MRISQTDSPAPKDSGASLNAHSLFTSDLSRRAVLRYSAGGIALAWGGMLLTACGGGSSSGSTSASGSNSAGGGVEKVNPSASGPLTSAEKQTLLSMGGPSNKKFMASGVTWNIGAAFPFSGPYAYYQTIEGDGLKLAAQHIAQLGGPMMNLNFQNFGSTSGVDTQKAVQAMLAFHDQGAGVAVSGIQAALGALIPGAGRDKILLIDAGAGVGTFAGKDYYYALRNNYPLNNVTLACEHVKSTTPSARTAVVVYNSGAAFAPVLDGSVTAVKAAGLQVTGTATQPLGTTDWADSFASIRSQNPDVIVLVLNGNDGAYFLKQLPTSGLKQPVYTFSYSAPQQTIAGAGFEGVYVVQEAFLPDAPTNDWQKIFTKYYREEFTDQASSSSTPFNLSANYYGLGFLLWELASRVLATKGDINDGAALQKALTGNPTFPSIFGGSGTTPGQIKFDVSSHGLGAVPLAVFQLKNQSPQLLAVADAQGSTGASTMVKK
jgi:ABC-type branched-subunit amino acid transport system substrate-binding protein